MHSIYIILISVLNRFLNDVLNLHSEKSTLEVAQTSHLDPVYTHYFLQMYLNPFLIGSYLDIIWIQDL